METRSLLPHLREWNKGEWNYLSFPLNTIDSTRLWGRGCLTDLVVEFRKLHFNFVPLEIMILCLLAHRRYQVELACNRVRLLVPPREAKQWFNQHLCGGHINIYTRSWNKDGGSSRFTMISMALQREVPQYMAIPWFITNVMARTISANHTIGYIALHIKDIISNKSLDSLKARSTYFVHNMCRLARNII